MSNNNNTCVLKSVVLSAYLIASFSLFVPQSTTALHGDADGGSVPVVPEAGKHGTVVTVDQRRVVVATEFGEIAAVKVRDGKDGFYDLQFITMEPNSLLVPVHLHSDMVFYVSSGRGTLSWVDLDKEKSKLRRVELRTGDVYRLPTGSFFYMQSNLESDRRKFRIHAIFSDSKEEIRDGSSFGAYSSVADLLLGFDDKVLQAALNVNEAVLQELRSGGQKQLIVHGVSNANELFEMHYRSMRAFLGLIDNGMIDVNKNKKGKAYNILEAKHDVENCNGWSLVVTSKQMGALKDSDFGIFMVNLTKGAMMGPHWNPLTAEIAVVLSGRGMVHVVCPSTLDESECKNSRFRVEEGDVFVVPRYHPMAQISFNNGSFVFMGFTTTQENNHPQYLVGSASVFQVLDKRVLAASLGVSNTTMDELLSAQNYSIILECTSCAEEEERLMEEEIERQKEEEARKREEEERKKEEEEARKREEEEAARREEEEARKREEEEEEAARREQEEQEAKRRQEEEEAARQQEEAAAKQRQEEEAAARKAEEEARKREEEEAARREQEEQEAKRRQAEEEAARQQEEAAARQRQEEEEAATRRRQEEEAAAQEREEEAERRRQEAEELARQKREQEEAARRQQEKEEAARRQKQEEEAARQQEEAARRQKQEEEAARQQEEAARRQKQKEEAARQQEEAMRRQQEEEAARQQEEAMRRQQGEEAARQQEEEAAARQQEEGMRKQREQAAARQQEQAAARQQQEAMRKHQEEAATRQQEAAMRRQQAEEAGIQQEEGASRGSGQQALEQGEGEAARKREEEMAGRERS